MSQWPRIIFGSYCHFLTTQENKKLFSWQKKSNSGLLNKSKKCQSWPIIFFGHLLAIYWPFIGHILAIGHLLAIPLAIHWPFICHLLAIFIPFCKFSKNLFYKTLNPKSFMGLSKNCTKLAYKYSNTVGGAFRVVVTRLNSKKHRDTNKNWDNGNRVIQCAIMPAMQRKKWELAKKLSAILFLFMIHSISI